MTTSRILLIGATGLLLTACSRPYEVHEISGDEDKFCVPKDHLVGRVPWIPANTPKGNGFAFSGCWSSDRETQKNCPFPALLVGGVTSSAAAFRKQRWQDIGDESLIKRTIRDSNAIFDVMDGGNVVVTSNPKMYWGWFVWRKATPLIQGMSARLDADDELIATCAKENVALPGATAIRRAVMCLRDVQGENYSLSYSFESKNRAPIDIEKLDAQVFAGIDSWRCKK